MDISEKLRRILLSTAAGGAMLLALHGVAHAQDAAVETVAEEEEEAAEGDRTTVTVRGFRASIESSIAAKRDATSIVEAISAEDIGKLPDVSIAESIARLPGLAAQRLRGRSQVISVRGLGPDFTTALLNGREQVTAGDNRGVEFDQYPSELINQVIVYKTPDAALLGQGLAGTADLRTIRPLDFGERSFTLNARYEWNDLGKLNPDSEDTGYRLTGTYVDQFADDTFGLVLGVAVQTSPTQAERFEAWGYDAFDINGVTDSAGNPFPAGVASLNGAKPYVESRELERTSINGTLEFSPTDTFETSVDMFYTDFEDNGTLRGIEFPLRWGDATLQPGYVVEDGIIFDGNWVGVNGGPGVKGVARNDYRGRSAELRSIGWNTKFSPFESWHLELDYSHSRVERQDIDLETYSGTGFGHATGAADAVFGMTGVDRGFVFSSQVDYTDPNIMFLTDPRGWNQVGFIKEPSINDELNAIRLSVEREFADSPFSSVKVGVNRSNREKDKVSVENFLDLANPGATNTTPIPAQFLLAPTSLSHIGINGVISYDVLGVLNSGVYSLRPLNNLDVIQKSWRVKEDVTTAFVMVNLDTELGSLPLTGNFGLQMVDTDQESTGTAFLNGGLNPYTAGDSYTEYLPSVNLQLALPADQFLRFGAARTLARSRMDDMRATQGVNVNTQVCTGVTPYNLDQGQVCLNANGGNPQLRPYMADSFDISYEKYFGSSGYVSAALFYKDLSDYVEGNIATTFDLGTAFEAIYAQAFPSFTYDPRYSVGTLTAPGNGEGGHLQGLEIAASVPGDLFLPAPFDGLGVIASASFTESEVTDSSSGATITIPGLSETVTNVTVYYEKDGFEARVSNRYRSEFLGEVTGFGANREFRTVDEESVVDAQIGYAFTRGPLDGVSIQLQANNLTNERFRTFINNDPRLVKDWEEYGTTYLLGLTYRR